MLKSEPDALSDRLTYGPRIFVSLAVLDKTGIVKPGTLVRWRYAVKLADGKQASEQEMQGPARACDGRATRGGLHHARPARSVSRK